ncbi:MAG TPA: hypothetical protein VFS20_03860 [Longimicrobium sp.]|nr:hypothetical protein [Longimicrobium sp.]
MKKLQLSLESLSVEAFATGRDCKAGVRGTVRANAATDGCQPFPTGNTTLLTIRSDCTVPPTLGCPVTTDEV